MKLLKKLKTSQKQRIIQLLSDSPKGILHQDDISLDADIPLNLVQTQISQINKSETKYKKINIKRYKSGYYGLVNNETKEKDIIDSIDFMGKKGIGQFKRRNKLIEIAKNTRDSIEAENQLMNQVLKMNLKNSMEVASLLTN